jgi:hypothetical protein
MRRRRISVRRQAKWTANEWEQGWELVMTRINGVPTGVETERFFQDCLTVLNGAFADGNVLRFQLGINALLDFCADRVNEGDSEQWWK